jgi:phosphate:Na+ symporter
LDKNVLGHAAKRLKRNLLLSREQGTALDAIMARLVANVLVAASVFMSEDPRVRTHSLRRRCGIARK